MLASHVLSLRPPNVVSQLSDLLSISSGVLFVCLFFLCVSFWLVSTAGSSSVSNTGREDNVYKAWSSK